MQLIAQSSQKPKIQVNFDIASGNLFHDTFNSVLDSIKPKALNILINGLNDHIGFLEFNKEFDAGTQIYELNVVLDKDPLTLGSNEEYLLNFTMNGSSTQNEPVNPTFFAFTTDVLAFSDSYEGLLESFEQKLEDYLGSSANNDLVNKLFKSIPFVLPDSDHFLILSSTTAAVLPFSKNDLNIDYTASIFNVTMNYIDNGISITKPDTNRAGIAEVERQFGQVTKGCILIELDTNISDFLKGEVFIISYIRKIYPPSVPDSDPNAFTNSITD